MSNQRESAVNPLIQSSGFRELAANVSHERNLIGWGSNTRHLQRLHHNVPVFPSVLLVTMQKQKGAVVCFNYFHVNVEPDLNISAAWINWCNIHGPQRMNSADFGDH